MTHSAMRNKEITTVMAKTSSGMLAAQTSSGYPMFLTLPLSLWAPFILTQHLFLGWALPPNHHHGLIVGFLFRHYQCALC